MGANPQADKSAFGIERTQTLYGSLPEQLKDSKSFVSQLRRMLKAQKSTASLRVSYWLFLT